MIPLTKVIIFGGTHGNEWTGIMVVNKYAESLKAQFKQLDLHFVHANPEAFKLNRRFKDEDLNRAFEYLQDERPQSYEHSRAKTLKMLINEDPCFVIDLHTTTSNMGNTIIVSHAERINFQVASDLVENLPDTRVILSPDPTKKYLASQSTNGIMIEVGPVANGLINGKALKSTLELLTEILRSISNLAAMRSGSIEIYEEIEHVYYPQDEQGEITGYIHEDFQGNDFIPLSGQYTAFKAFTGENQISSVKEKLYPIFINEAAYYPAKLAYTLCKKSVLTY